ncbi:MAG: hypothetical protein A2V79_02675 [Betaproteobacteria bacterium RBG_16_56_24]|nr:MAG: hypothetical protein A2V79_02675 [Betaproteobacteria bacterium RBG_16_56_24]
MNATAAQAGEDSAWISVELPLSQSDACTFIQRTELLFRLNPYLEIKSWQEDAPGRIYPGKRIRLDSLNEMNGMAQTMTLSVSDVQPDISYSLNYDRGLKQATVFTVEGITPVSCRLIVKERYPSGISPAEREARLNEVDKSLMPWGADIHKYFTRRARWGWLPFFGWLQDSFWLGMAPRHRRIARLLIWTTVLEFVVFLFVFVIYWLELGRGHT